MYMYIVLSLEIGPEKMVLGPKLSVKILVRGGPIFLEFWSYPENFGPPPENV